MSSIRIVGCTVLLAWTLFAGAVRAADLDEEILGLQNDWAAANYATPPGAAQLNAFEALAQRAAAVSERYPQRAEPLVWEGIVLSTYAGAKGGLGALSLAKKARTRLEAALKMNADALDGSVYTSLGTLYHKVPGFPLGFGDDAKARTYLKQALAINPQGIDPNFFYGEYLFDTGNHQQAREYLQRAQSAPAREGREAADAGRRQDIAALLKKLDAKASRQAAR